MHNPDNLEDYSVIKDEEVNEEDVQMVEEESEVAMN